MSDGLRVDTAHRCLQWSGVVNFVTVSQVRTEGLKTLQQHPGQWQVDLSELQTASSLVAAVLVHWWSQLQEHGGEMQLHGVSEPMQAVLRVYGLGWL